MNEKRALIRGLKPGDRVRLTMHLANYPELRSLPLRRRRSEGTVNTVGCRFLRTTDLRVFWVFVSLDDKLLGSREWFVHDTDGFSIELLSRMDDDVQAATPCPAPSGRPRKRKR